MGYFKNIRKVEYLGRSTPDITRSLSVHRYGMDSFFDYTIQDGETPEMLAHRIYRNPNDAVYVLIMNDIVDPYEEWPVDSGTLRTLAHDMYDDIHGIHHYENTLGDVVPVTHPDYDRVPITNIEYETRKNDKKRSIRLLLPELMPDMKMDAAAMLRI
jgi:hypothetical protein